MCLTCGISSSLRVSSIFFHLKTALGRVPWLLLKKFHHYLGGRSAFGEGNGDRSSALAWRIPATGEPGGLPSMGSHRVGHD